MSKDTVSTIGDQKRQRIMHCAQIWPKLVAAEVTEGLLPPPAYFGMNVDMNKKDTIACEIVLNLGMRAPCTIWSGTGTLLWTLVRGTKDLFRNL
jgi:hypothetical protein